MRKPKFKVGQTVHVMADYYDHTKTSIGKIKSIQITENVSETAKGQKKITSVQYRISLQGYGERHFQERLVFGDKNEFYSRQRKKEKSKAKASVTRAEKALVKNEKKLADLQEKLKVAK